MQNNSIINNSLIFPSLCHVSGKMVARWWHPKDKKRASRQMGTELSFTDTVMYW